MFSVENSLFSNVFLLFFISEIAAVQLLQAWLALAQWQGQQILVKPWALKKETALLAAFHSRFLRISEIFLRLYYISPVCLDSFSRFCYVLLTPS